MQCNSTGKPVWSCCTRNGCTAFSMKSADELTICSLMTLPSSSTVLIFCKCIRQSDQHGHPLNRIAVIRCRGRDTYKVDTDRGDVALCVGVILHADRTSVRRACQTQKAERIGEEGKSHVPQNGAGGMTSRLPSHQLAIAARHPAQCNFTHQSMKMARQTGRSKDGQATHLE